MGPLLIPDIGLRTVGFIANITLPSINLPTRSILGSPTPRFWLVNLDSRVAKTKTSVVLVWTQRLHFTLLQPGKLLCQMGMSIVPSLRPFHVISSPNDPAKCLLLVHMLTFSRAPTLHPPSLLLAFLFSRLLEEKALVPQAHGNSRWRW